jgi:hypothetical protein
MSGLLSLTSLATCAVSGWMTGMFFVLRHPGYQWRAAMAATICLGAATLVAGRPPRALRIPIAIWGAALAALGVSVLFSGGDDGWAGIASLLFIVEGVLAVVASLRGMRSAPRAAHA